MWKLRSCFSGRMEPVASGTLKEGFFSIKNKISEHYEELSELAEKYKAPATPSPAEIHSNPIILCLGNHSSGKSSFVNHILSQNIQESSAAPLDDCFTLFTYGKPYDTTQNFVEQSGEGLVLNRRLPFHSLSNIKGKFLHKVKLKYVQEKKLEEIMLVDSPGMIDGLTQQREYDFLGAIQWFADRADLILFFFDPDKPGTSGESLAVFSQLLNKADHKIVIVLNKSDSFATANDLARTYGTLCWNLAKLISFKDMPMIYTTHLPSYEGLPTLQNSLADLQRKIFTAPARHVDTLITDFQRYTRRLLIICRITSRVRCEVSSAWWRVFYWIMFIASILMTGCCYLMHDSPHVPIVLVLCAIIFITLAVILPYLHSKQREVEVLKNLEGIFRAEYYLELRNNREDSERLWGMVNNEIESSIKEWGSMSFPVFSSTQRRKTERFLVDEVQMLLEHLQKIVAS